MDVSRSSSAGALGYVPYFPENPQPYLPASHPLAPDYLRLTAFCGASSLESTAVLSPSSTVAISPRSRVRPPRGEVLSLSPRSRVRLMTTLARVPRDLPFRFVTLTYPGDPARWSLPYLPATDHPLPGPRGAKADLDVFFKRVARLYPDASAHWKLEPQQRGVPHFHLIFYGLPDDCGPVLCDAWHEIVGRGDPFHVRPFHKDGLYHPYGPGFDMGDSSTDPARARWYVAKYASKDGPQPLNPDSGEFSGMSPGRFWGIHNRASLPVAEKACFAVHDRKQTAMAIRIMRNLQHSKKRDAYRRNLDKWILNKVPECEAARPSNMAFFNDTKAFGFRCTDRLAKTVRLLRWTIGRRPMPKWRDPPSCRLNAYFVQYPEKIISQLAGFFGCDLTTEDGEILPDSLEQYVSLDSLATIPPGEMRKAS